MGSCGQNQTRAEAGIFLLDASKVLTVETILMKMINFRLSRHLSSMLVNDSWLDSCMGSFRRNTFSLKAWSFRVQGCPTRGAQSPLSDSPDPLDPTESTNDLRILFIVYFTLEHRKINNEKVRTHIHRHESCTTTTWGIDPRVMFIYISFIAEQS